MTRRTVSLSLLTRGTAGSVLLASLVAGTFGVLLLAVSHLRNSTDVQVQSRNVTSATLGLEGVVNELEASLRAYVVSGNSRFLVTWERARRELPLALARMNDLLSNQADQARAGASLATLVGDYVTEYGVPLIAIFKLKPEAARAPVATREGLFRIDTIRARLGRLLSSEAALASANASSARREAGDAIRAGIGALSIAAALLVLYGLFLVRGIAGPVRTVATAASRLAAGDLSIRLPEQGATELLALTSAFNTMARSLEQGKRELEVQNEELRQSERLKSELVSIVSHELRTPLASILGYTRLLRSREFEKAQVDRYLEIIDQQGHRLTSLIDHFLDSEKIESGELLLDKERFDLKPLLLQEAQLVADKVTRHRIEVTVPTDKLPVRGDRDRLAQVFANLLTNAVRYSPDGGIVEIVGEATREVVRVGVRDEGLGIPEEHQSRIFTKFFRGHARESGIAGTGLGLAVTREIVEAHDGRIGFTSHPGDGSHFWFELPLAPEPRPHRDESRSLGPAPAVP